MKTAEIETRQDHADTLPRVSETVSQVLSELIVVLDEDIKHMRQTLSRLDELRGSLIKRDNGSLGRLLEQIRADADSYARSEQRRQSIRKQLAESLGCSSEQITLSALVRLSSQPVRTDLAERQKTLKALTGALKKEVIRTSMLLAECARVNRVLLKSILRFKSPQAVTYSAAGTASVHSDMSFLNCRF